MIHSDGHVCGVIVGNSYFAGNDRTMTSAYMGCPIGSKIIFQTKPSPSGNVAGWHGTDVTYSAGVFRLGNGTTISNGIATDLDGRVWDTGSNATITPATTTTSTTTTTTTIPKTTTTSTTVAPKVTTTVQPTSSTVVISGQVTTTTMAVVVDDGVEEGEVVADISLQKSGNSYMIRVASNREKTQMQIIARKKGAKNIVWTLTSDGNGAKSILTSRNLKGFTLALRVDGETVDTAKVS